MISIIVQKKKRMENRSVKDMGNLDIHNETVPHNDPELSSSRYNEACADLLLSLIHIWMCIRDRLYNDMNFVNSITNYCEVRDR